MKHITRCLLPILFASLTLYAQIPNFQHIVVIVQENRTPDNLFHFLTPACRLVEPRRGNASCIPAEVGYSITEKENGGQPCELPAVLLSGWSVSG